MTILLDTLPPGNVGCEVRTVLHAFDIKVARHAIGPIPPLPRPSIGARIVERMPRSRRDAKRVADLILEKVRPSRGPLVDFFIAAGESSLGHHDANSAMFTIDGRSLDCDEYERAARDSVRGSRYGVFVDSGGPAHPDFELLGIKPSGKAETYFATLRSFLEKAQDATGLPIVIARHPRMTRVNYSD